MAKQLNPRPGEASLRNSMRMPWQRQWIMAVFPRGRGIVPLISYSQKAAHRAVFWTVRALSIDILGSLRSRWALLRRDAYAWYSTYRVVFGFPRWGTAGQDADFLEYVLERCHAVNPRKAVSVFAIPQSFQIYFLKLLFCAHATASTCVGSGPECPA